jgi:hypothetical protein
MVIYVKGRTQSLSHMPTRRVDMKGWMRPDPQLEASAESPLMMKGC